MNGTPVIVESFNKDGFRYNYLTKDGIGSLIVIKEDEVGTCIVVFPANSNRKITSRTSLLCKYCSTAEKAIEEFCRITGKLATKPDNSKYFFLQQDHPRLNVLDDKIFVRQELNKLIQKIEENTDLFDSNVTAD